MATKTTKQNEYSEFNIAIGKRLKQIKHKYEYSQENMAEILGISPAYYGKVERGKHCLAVDKLCLLHDKLGVDLNYLISGDEISGSYKELDSLLSEVPSEDKTKLALILKDILSLTKKSN